MGEVNYTDVTLGAPSELVGGGYRMPIAVNDRDRHGKVVDLSRMRTDRYMDNPVVKWKHGKGGIDTPIGTTTALRWDQRVREADFVFAQNDDDAGRIRNLYEQGTVRAASIGWVDTPDDPNYDTELVEWSLTDIPADPEAVRTLTESVISDILERNKIREPEGSAMGDQDTQTRALSTEDMEQVRAMMEDMLNKRLGKHMDDKERSALVDDFTALATTTVNDAFKARDAAAEQARAAEEAQAQAEADVQARAMARADLMIQVRNVGLIPDDEDVSAMTDREIRIRAIGDELENAEDRSDDYIAAVLDGIVNRRSVANDQRQQMAVNNGNPVVNAADLDADGLRAAIIAQSISPQEAITRSQEFYRQEQARRYAKAGGR